MTNLIPPTTSSIGINPSPPLALTIRFSASVPDLDLDIPHPTTTTVISLKHLIRSRLKEPNSQRRLRFIQAGKILPDTAALSSVLRQPPHPPPSDDELFQQDRIGAGAGAGKGKKGKNVIGKTPQQRIYINCSIGDSLTTSELEAEAQAASLKVQIPTNTTTTTPAVAGPGTNTANSPLQPSTSVAPRGFDRLLSAGFTAAEVNQLRLQFRSIRSSRFTSDTLPSPDSFRHMEDAWIDDNSGAVPTTAAAAEGGGGAVTGGFESDEVGIAGQIDALIWGVLTGFMWPLGSFGWLMREHGMHSDRWRFMVGVGVLFGLLIGFVRGISGDR